MTNQELTQYIEENILREQISYRGGGVEIDLTDLLPDFTDHTPKMTAYQNYLGGGMTGRICNDYNFELSDLAPSDEQQVKDIAEALTKYFYNVQNDNNLYADEYAKPESLDQLQSRPVSGY